MSIKDILVRKLSIKLEEPELYLSVMESISAFSLALDPRPDRQLIIRWRCV